MTVRSNKLAAFFNIQMGNTIIPPSLPPGKRLPGKELVLLGPTVLGAGPPSASLGSPHPKVNAGLPAT